MEISICNEFFYRLAGETEQELYSKFNTCKENVFRNNPNIPLYEGEWVKIKVNNYLTHIVKPLQTITSVANIHKVKEADVIKWNDLKTSKLFIGQHLKIYK